MFYFASDFNQLVDLAKAIGQGGDGGGLPPVGTAQWGAPNSVYPGGTPPGYMNIQGGLAGAGGGNFYQGGAPQGYMNIQGGLAGGSPWR